jgi:hypothetical protein
MKKGQTTVLIIVSILIVLGILATALIISSNKKAENERYFSQSTIKPSINSIKSQTSDCNKETAKNALKTIGHQGGYHSKPPLYTDFDDSFLPYYYDQGKYLMPTKEIIQKQIALNFHANLKNCLNNIKEETFEINFKNPSTKVTINEDHVRFDITLPNTISKEDHYINLEIEPIIIPSRLLGILTMAEYITESHKQDAALYCINCVAALAELENIYVDNVQLQNNVMLIIISENDLSSTPYSFTFANKYTGNEKSPIALEEDAPEVEYE